MSNLCGSCEHSVTEHQMQFGGCQQQCVDPNWGDFYCCPCSHFEKDDSDD